MVVKEALAGNYADVNQPLSGVQAKELADAGILGIARYIPREPALAAGNATQLEIEDIIQYLALWFVQHCPLPNWMPTAALGRQWGSYAVEYLVKIGVPKLVSVFLDLEGVSSSALSTDVIAYVQAWMKEVSAGGYTVGLYCGWANGLTPGQLYSDLSVTSYWAAYNYTDGVATRGVQITQHPQRTIAGIIVDPDTIAPDLLGGLPMLLYNS